MVEYSVNGSAIPDVDFDIGESYAGLMPISKEANETSELYFWFFPSSNPSASDEILIWLNGGVCSGHHLAICRLTRNSPVAHLLKVYCKKMGLSSGNMVRTNQYRTHILG